MAPLNFSFSYFSLSLSLFCHQAVQEDEKGLPAGEVLFSVMMVNGGHANVLLFFYQMVFYYSDILTARL